MGDPRTRTERPASARRRPAGWLAYLLLGTAAAVVYAFRPGPWVQALLLVVVAAGSSTAVLVGVRRSRPAHALPWLLAGACQALWAVAWLIWQIHVLGHGGAPQPGSSADALFLAGDAFMIVALALLVGARDRGSAALADSLILALAIALVTWSTLIGPYADHAGLPLATRTTQILYASADMAVFVLLLRFALWRRARHPAVELLAAGMTAYLAADISWNWLTLAGVYVAGSSYDVGWLLFSVLVGAAGLHPSVARQASLAGTRVRLSRPGAVLLACAALTPPALVLVERWRSGHISMLVLCGGAGLTSLVVLRLVRVVRRAEQLTDQLRDADFRFRALVERLPLVTYIDAVNASASNLYTSPQVEELLGFTAEEWREDPEMFERLLHPDDRERVMALVEHCNATGDRFLSEFRLRTRDGRMVWVRDESVIVYDDDGRPLHAQGFMLDISTRRRAEEELAHLAYHDALTGLPNRLSFEDELAQAIADCDTPREGVAVLFADLDDFKLVNDGFGHAAGDELLREVGARLQGAAGGALVARQGGDEFLVLVRAPLGELAARAGTIADAIGTALQPPFPLAGLDVYASASVGISLYPLDAGDAASLLKHADVAMYEAKRNGRDGWQRYGGTDDALTRLELATRLRTAVERQELALHYQPIVELASGRIVGAEALVRWRLDGALVPPDQFIALAERTGAIRGITRWVVEEATATLAAWDAAGREPIGMSVNVSPVTLDGDLVEHVGATAARHAIDPHRLTLEITETGVMTEADRSLPVLEELAGQGLRLAIDDFGTGHSSLSRLAALPVRTLKIDRSFVQNLDRGSSADALVTSIVQLALTLGREPLAEGIETEAQRRLLLSRGCQLGQGYLFSRPVEATAFAVLLDDGRRAAA